MTTSAHEPTPEPDDAGFLDRHTSRRGFMAKTAAIVGGFGLGMFGFEALANATPGCCPGTVCATGCPTGACASTIGCPPGYTVGAHTQCCLADGHVEFCTQCTKSGASTCNCGCRSQLIC